MADKVRESEKVMAQLKSNTRKQAMLGDFPRAVDNAVIGSTDAHRNQMMQLPEYPNKSRRFPHVIHDPIEGDAARSDRPQ